MNSLYKRVILNVTEGGVKDLLYLPFNTGTKRRSTKCYDCLTRHTGGG
jgi:hypothetical protein